MIEPFFLSKTSKELQNNSINIIGFPYDKTACFRKGTRFGPNDLREISDGLESYSPYLEKDLEDISYYDLLNLIEEHTNDWDSALKKFDELTNKKNLKQESIKLLGLGGEHSISYPFLKKYLSDFDDLLIIHLDAHADLRDGFEGYHYSHASIICRAHDHMTPKHSLMQYGIRSGTKDEFKWMHDNGTLYKSLSTFTEELNAVDPTRPIYLTLDLDFFDPAFLPGTGTPEAGGESFHSFISIVKLLNNKNLVGADVVELSPPLDQSGNSSIFASKVVRELILAMSDTTYVK
jgi:agmatinase